jgi:hypothetical protein
MSGETRSVARSSLGASCVIVVAAGARNAERAMKFMLLICNDESFVPQRGTLRGIIAQAGLTVPEFISLL